MPRYLVVALYEDNDQRYATEVDAFDVERAEELAQVQANLDNGDEMELKIAGVVQIDLGAEGYRVVA
jgi:hypothetical protein